MCFCVDIDNIFTFVCRGFSDATLKVFRYERPFWRLQGFSGEALVVNQPTVSKHGAWWGMYPPNMAWKLHVFHV